ncbi:MAG: uncharacterized protein JWN48_946 [Myxococcaceae bacterium]|nr:uncharacterized protein [Myxococcaceae bacterium]
MMKTLLGVFGFCALGCAHQPAPTEQLANSMAAVRGAEEAGALAVPEAALQVKLAQEEIAQAQKLVANGDNGRAQDRALRAGNDAELAVALAREDAAKKKLEQVAQASRAAGGEMPQQQGMPQ